MEIDILNKLFIEVTAYIKANLNDSSVIDDKSKEQILHYLNVDEYEMAYEGFLIEIHKNKAHDKFDANRILAYAKILNLENEACFDIDIFQKIKNAYKELS